MYIRNEWVVENFQNIFTIFLDPLSDQTSNWLSDLTTLSQNWPLQRALFFCDVPVFKFWKNAFNKAVNLFRAVHCSFRFNYLICSASTIYVAVNCEQLPFQLCSRFLLSRLTINWMIGDRIYYKVLYILLNRVFHISTVQLFSRVRLHVLLKIFCFRVFQNSTGHPFSLKSGES